MSDAKNQSKKSGNNSKIKIKIFQDSRAYRNLVEEWKVNTHTWSEFQYWAEQTLTWLVQAWKQQYNKSYPTQKEDCDRMKIWMKYKVLIEKWNQEYKKVRKALYYVIISFTTLREFTLTQGALASTATSAKRSFLQWRTCRNMNMSRTHYGGGIA